jgi:hypothetical protein
MDKRFKKKYGIIIETIDVNSSIVKKAYYPLYLIRRLGYAVILSIFHRYPMLQVLLIIFVIILPVSFEPNEIDASILNPCESFQR